MVPVYAVEVRNVSKSFGGEAAVKGVTFNIPAGELVLFLGPNG
ncbi:MAG TPA: ABC transporter ATP-binding protein, partial [Aigarchaeota archaeon]|nr:ABC transporter ATP-binding protein [Aigarchaeota archaeon]